MKRKLFISAFIFIPLFLTTTACGNHPTISGSQPTVETTDKNTSSSEEKPIESEVGLVYTHTKTNIEWASEEIKKTQLDEMGIDEKTFKRVQGKAAAGGFSATIRNLVFISCPDVNSLM